MLKAAKELDYLGEVVYGFADAVFAWSTAGIWMSRVPLRVVMRLSLLVGKAGDIDLFASSPVVAATGQGCQLQSLSLHFKLFI